MEEDEEEEEEEEADKYMLVRKRKPMAGYMNVSSPLLCFLFCLSCSVGPGSWTQHGSTHTLNTNGPYSMFVSKHSQTVKVTSAYFDGSW